MINKSKSINKLLSFLLFSVNVSLVCSSNIFIVGDQDTSIDTSINKKMDRNQSPTIIEALKGIIFKNNNHHQENSIFNDNCHYVEMVDIPFPKNERHYGQIASCVNNKMIDIGNIISNIDKNENIAKNRQENKNNCLISCCGGCFKIAAFNKK